MKTPHAAINARLLAAALAASLMAPVGPVFAADDYNLPDLGQPADTAMSPAEEKKLGAQVVTQLRAQNRIIDDPTLNEYINDVGHRLLAATDSPNRDVTFYVINTGDINAFALPGGYIGVNAGLITATKTESELASVLAHELAHVTQRHIARQMADSKGDAIATMATALVAAIAGASAGAGQAASAAIMGGMSHLGMQQIAYTRTHEYEADRVGIHTLADAGYDAHAMSRFFGTLQRQSDLYGRQPPQILLSHPVSSTRMAEAEARAAGYPDRATHVDPEYAYMKARVRVLTAQSPNQTRDYFARERAEHDTPALDYGYALGLIRTSNEEAAVDLLATGNKTYPDVVAWPLALAEAYNQSGAYTQADDVLDDAAKRFPHDDAVALAIADNLFDRGDYRALRDRLLADPALLDRYPSAQRLLADAAAKTDDYGEAYYRQARYFAMIGDYPQAINQLRTALQTGDLSDYNKARLAALRDQMVSACHAAWSPQTCQRAVAQNADY
tara:strand:- start:61 stop:1566 length:1506 start_codon:yes stop_codon:yes gene_type:complete